MSFEGESQRYEQVETGRESVADLDEQRRADIRREYDDESFLDDSNDSSDSLEIPMDIERELQKYGVVRAEGGLYVIDADANLSFDDNTKNVTCNIEGDSVVVDMENKDGTMNTLVVSENSITFDGQELMLNVKGQTIAEIRREKNGNSGSLDTANSTDNPEGVPNDNTNTYTTIQVVGEVLYIDGEGDVIASIPVEQEQLGQPTDIPEDVLSRLQELGVSKTDQGLKVENGNLSLDFTGNTERVVSRVDDNGEVEIIVFNDDNTFNKLRIGNGSVKLDGSELLSNV